MKVAVLTSRYPSINEPYSHMFVHTRNKWYQKLGLVEQLTVFVPSLNEACYSYEDIKVKLLPIDKILKLLPNFDVAFCHLLHFSHRKELDGGRVFSWMLDNGFPAVLYIHGVESQSIYKSRPQDISISKPKSLLRWLYRDLYLLKRFTSFLSSAVNSSNFKIITPSNWMAKDVLFNTGIDISSVASIIPNGVDTKLFCYRDNLWDNGRKATAIRPLYFSGKYAVDLFIETASNSSSSDNFTLYGSGPDEELIVAKIKNLKHARNFTVKSGFLANASVPDVHSKHSIYYAVTRMDAQGVSMCEAMSSGLPIVTFGVCAIPEFVSHGVEGFLVDSYDTQKALDYMYELWESRDLFDRVSLAARARAESIDIRKTVALECELGVFLMGGDNVK